MFRIVIATLLCLPSITLAQGLDVEQVITIKMPPGQMRYDIARFEVAPGQKVKIVLQNDDAMPHNLVVCKPGPGDDKGLPVAMKAWELAEKGAEKHWIPEHERVLFATRMAEPKGKAEVSFTVPKETGDYPYVCTFPGHAMLMNGTMRVTTGGPRVQNLKYKLYLGAWDHLPDFSKLKAEKEGDLPTGLMGWKFGDYKNEFGMEFTGAVKAEKKGRYRFYLASDDGAALYVDGQPLITNDGVHPSSTLQAKELNLEPGEHAIRVTYFEQAGEEELYVAWQGPGFLETPLSEWIPEGRKGKRGDGDRDRNVGIELGPENGEPAIYRNFIDGSSPRGICVGYPGGVNLCYDADQMSLAMLWRGAFIDAKRHWSDRGGGNQPPLGYSIVKPAPVGVSLALLPDAKAPWPARTPRAEGIQFKGYVLDKKRAPAFRWQRGGLAGEESFEPSGDQATVDAKLTRTIKLSGSAEPNLFLRVAVGSMKEVNGAYAINAAMTVKVDTPGAQVREAGGTKELLVPINPAAQKEVKITYQWSQ